MNKQFVDCDVYECKHNLLGECDLECIRIRINDVNGGLYCPDKEIIEKED